ncbi:MAG: glycosyltransferase family 2 protein [Chloroflexota bacterium]|nr:glycosyltransferase family 2 protein [Chloroflexota bacterium]MDQ5866080.1 glycosyltransferase family 2 protein [Chloroflexota bacterium]
MAEQPSSIVHRPSSIVRPMPETAVIILNWNGARLLPECLSALAAQAYRDFELWLVDNGSIDGSHALLDDLERTLQPEWLAHPLPRAARIIRNSDNVGFAGGNNQGMRLCAARYVVALNNDAIADDGWLGQLVETARTGGRSVGMVASTMLFSHRPELVASAGISVHADGVALDRAPGMLSTELERVGTRPVFGPSAGAALYTATMLRDVGLFDERFFSYLEDADLAWRARSRGWRALHNPHARVRHEYSATGGHNSAFKRRLLARNRVWLLYKNMPTALMQRHAPLIARYDLLAVLNALLTGDRASLKGRLEGLSSLRRFTDSRRKGLSSARLHPDELDRLMAPALSPRQVLKYRRRIDSILTPSS